MVRSERTAGLGERRSVSYGLQVCAEMSSTLYLSIKSQKIREVNKTEYVAIEYKMK